MTSYIFESESLNFRFAGVDTISSNGEQRGSGMLSSSFLSCKHRNCMNSYQKL